MIHGDVFRSPQSLSIFTALIGSGAQIFSTVLLLLICVLIGVFKATKRGALLTAVILIYALCGVIGGIVAARIFKQLKGKYWVWNVVLTASVFPVPLGIVFTWVNSVAWNRESTAALPTTTIMVSMNLRRSILCVIVWKTQGKRFYRMKPYPSRIQIAHTDLTSFPSLPSFLSFHLSF